MGKADMPQNSKCVSAGGERKNNHILRQEHLGKTDTKLKRIVLLAKAGGKRECSQCAHFDGDSCDVDHSPIVRKRGGDILGSWSLIRPSSRARGYCKGYKPAALEPTEA